MRKAEVYMNGVFAGMLEEIETKKGISYVFTYDESYRTSKGIPLSVTMPTTTAAYESKDLHNFFNGLIPEGWLLSLAARKFGVNTKDRMGLLLSLCEQNIGAAEIKSDVDQRLSALQIAGDEIKTIQDGDSEYKIPSHDVCLSCLLPLKESGENRNYHEDCSMRLFGHARPPLLKLSPASFEEPAVENLTHKLSLTGVQAKFAAKINFEANGEKDRRTFTSSPEYIFKPEPKHEKGDRIDYRGLSKLEQFSLTLARRLGIPTAESGLLYLEGLHPVFVTKRFDRRDGEKIHAEDFAQILERTYGDDKYTGSMEQIFKALSEYAKIYKNASLEALLRATILNFVLGNSDNHNKNFSIIIAKGKTGTIEAAISPFYDIVPTLIFMPEDKEESALTIGARKASIKAENFQDLTKRVPGGQKLLSDFIEKIRKERAFIEAALDGLDVPETKKKELLALMDERLSRFETDTKKR
jgi:serine/threonine-protein kinase HipA